MAIHEPNWRFMVDDLRGQFETDLVLPAERGAQLDALVDWLLSTGRLRKVDMAPQTLRERKLGLLDCLADTEDDDD